MTTQIVGPLKKDLARLYILITPVYLPTAAILEDFIFGMGNRTGLWLGVPGFRRGLLVK